MAHPYLILPSGQSQLLINLGPLQYLIERGPPERRVPFNDIWYSALQQSPIDSEAPNGNALLGIAFHAHGGYQWLGGALADGSEQILPLADLLGARVWARMMDQKPTYPAVLWCVAITDCETPMEIAAGRYLAMICSVSTCQWTQ